MSETKKQRPKVAVAKKQLLKYTLVAGDVTAPTRAYESDAGFDLYAARKITIAGNTVKLVLTGVAFQIPDGYFGKIYDRSGFGSQTTLSVKAGVIDSGYRGDVRVIMANTGPYPVRIAQGEKIAQMVILPVPEFELREVKKLAPSKRGEKGFGSSD